MAVESPDLKAAAMQYGEVLRQVSGSPPVLDLVHLGLGPDGHTASLVPGDAALSITDADVAVTGVYQGRRRMTLTYPAINRARRILWVVTGSEKTEMLQRLSEGDTSIPAGRVSREPALVLADRAAAGKLTAETHPGGWHARGSPSSMLVTQRNGTPSTSMEVWKRGTVPSGTN